MRAVRLAAPHTLVATDMPAPDGRALAVVALEQVGICGTDVKIHAGKIPVAYPRILGHELVGRVLRPSPAGAIAEGTRVLVDPGIACGRCALCRADRPNLCPNGALLGRDLDGGFVEQLAIDEAYLHPLPDSISVRASTLLQVLGTCVHGQSGLDIAPPDAAVVVGLGVAGMLHLELLLARGIRRIVGVARSPAKRALALELGAASAVGPEEAEAAVRDVTSGAGAPLVIEAVGTVATLARAVRLAAPGATVLAFGTITASHADDFPWYQLYYRELRLLNPRAALPRDYDRAIALAAAGDLLLEPLWSRSFPLERAADAFAALASDAGYLKVTLEV